jgi:hypothetical protein
MIFFQLLLFTLGGLFLLYLQRFLNGNLNLLLLLSFIIFGVFVFSPDGLNLIAEYIGIGRGVDVIIYLAIPIISIISIKQSLAIKQNSEKLAEITRSQAVKDFKEEYQDQLK